MTENTDRLTKTIIARVEPDLKAAFKKHVKSRKLKESELVRRLILRELGMDDEGHPIEADPEPASVAPDRLTVRLAPVVMEAAKTKAKSQGMPPSRWVSALVQSNVTRHPVLLTDEACWPVTGSWRQSAGTSTRLPRRSTRRFTKRSAFASMPWQRWPRRSIRTSRQSAFSFRRANRRG